MSTIRIFAAAILVLIIAGFMFFSAAVIDENKKVREANAALAKQLADLKAAPRYQGQAMRFLALMGPRSKTVMAVDGTVVITASDVPDLSKKVLDWLVRNPDESRKRGITELEAKAF